MLGEIRWFTWKTKAQQKEEAAQYAAWAFPYGDEQRKKLSELIRRRFPNEREQEYMVTYLTCKELISDTFMQIYNHPATRSRALDILKKDIKRYKRLFANAREDAPFYIALAMADRAIGPELEYPYYDEIVQASKAFDFSNM